MARAPRVLYNALFVPLARVALPVASRFDSKLRAGLEARHGAHGRWRQAAWKSAGRRPRIWVHASSAGESLQARPLVDAIRLARPSAAIFFSWWSLSAVGAIEGWEAVDHADVLPLDFPGRTRRIVESLEPDAILLVSAETWPNFVWAASDARVPVAQVCCRLARGSGRLRWPARGITRDVYRHMTAVATIGEDDAARVRALGVPVEAVAVTGDTRVDATLDRAARDGAAPWSPPPGAGPILVAGSTHPRDEAVLVPAIARLRGRHPALVAVVAPHEATATAIGALRDAAHREGLTTALLSDPAPGEPRAVVIVDTVGILYRLYSVAHVAFVGGAFDGSVHNTMEPAAHGVPIVVGPRPGPFHEVTELERAGAIVRAGSAVELTAAIEGWLADPAARAAAGEAALATLRRHRGATSRTLRFLRARGLPL
jgi:3-deoxy-D-manno-octulosonic-acid transferase